MFLCISISADLLVVSRSWFKHVNALTFSRNFPHCCSRLYHIINVILVGLRSLAQPFKKMANAKPKLFIKLGPFLSTKV